VSETPKYLIWSNEHVAWWRPESCGYTVSIADAGRYSRDDAMKICKGANYGFMQDTENPNEIPVLEADAVETMGARPYQRIVGQRRVRRQA
jgi:hypothetical protein